MPEGRFKIEFLNRSIPPENRTPLWFNTKEEVDSFVDMTKGCPCDEPIELRITEYSPTKVRRVTL
jgi:hypothetical protein